MTSLLTAVLRELLAMLLITHRSDAPPPKQRHLFQPLHLIQTKPLQDGSKLGRDIPSLVSPNGSPRPVNQDQIIGEGIWQTVRLLLAGKWQ